MCSFLCFSNTKFIQKIAIFGWVETRMMSFYFPSSLLLFDTVHYYYFQYKMFTLNFALDLMLSGVSLASHVTVKFYCECVVTSSSSYVAYGVAFTVRTKGFGVVKSMSTLIQFNYQRLSTYYHRETGVSCIIKLLLEQLIRSSKESSK